MSRSAPENAPLQCERRDELQKHLAGRGVQTVVHYNTPIHLQPAAESLGFATLCTSLPADQLLRLADVARFARRPSRAIEALEAVRGRFADGDDAAAAAPRRRARRQRRAAHGERAQRRPRRRRSHCRSCCVIVATHRPSCADGLRPRTR